MRSCIRILLLLAVVTAVTASSVLGQARSSGRREAAPPSLVPAAAVEAPPAGPAPDECVEDVVGFDVKVFDPTTGDITSFVRPTTGDITSYVRSGGRAPAKTVVIPSAAVEPQELAKIVEDMEIMSRILDKALGRESGLVRSPLPPITASNVVSQYYRRTRNAISETRGFFLEGYGALFVTQVDFPLAGEKTDEPADTEKPEPSVWEKTRQELYGATVPRRVPLSISYEQLAGTTEAAKPYDAKKVTGLEDTLLKTLEHAANIRSLKPEDTVAIAVLGRAAMVVGGSHVYLRRLEEGGKTSVVHVPWSQAVAARSTVLTIRVKKSDVDAFASGDLPFDEWRKKATILTY